MLFTKYYKSDNAVISLCAFHDYLWSILTISFLNLYQFHLSVAVLSCYLIIMLFDDSQFVQTHLSQM